MQRGFSLVELSIVLVILGLLTGGILAGQSLIRAAELRSVSTGFEKYRTAVMTFRDKYFGLPGDIPNAVKFWQQAAGGTADGVDATCAALDHTSPSTDQRTCNGNGDGRISSIYLHERFRSVQQLANAGLIEGSYTGVTGPTSAYDAVPGSNAMRGRISNTAYLITDYGNYPADTTNYFAGDYNNAIIFGGASGYSPTNVVLKPEEAWNIDTKMDDGKPGTGMTRTYPASTHVNCASSDVSASATYVLTHSSASCVLWSLQR